MTILKYIRFTNDFFLIFPHERYFPTCHQVADTLKQLAGMQALSAGQMIIDSDGGIVCSGESATLGIKSREKEDNEFFTSRLLPLVELPPSLKQ